MWIGRGTSPDRAEKRVCRLQLRGLSLCGDFDPVGAGYMYLCVAIIDHLSLGPLRLLFVVNQTPSRAKARMDLTWSYWRGGRSNLELVHVALANFKFLRSPQFLHLC